MNIFLREMKANLKSLIIWCLAQFFLILAGMIKYSGFSASEIDVDTLLEQFPAGLKAVFGLGQINLGEIRGYYAIFFLFFMLLASIHAAMLGAVLITKEERDHAADFLYAKPISRRRAISFKLAAGLANILIFNLLTLFTSLYYIGVYNKGNTLPEMVILLMGALLILQILFLSLGAALGAVMRTARRATGIVTAVILGSFILSIGVDLDARLLFLQYLTPFKYFDAKKLVYGGQYPMASLLLCFLLTAFCLFAAYRRFGRRDLAT